MPVPTTEVAATAPATKSASPRPASAAAKPPAAGADGRELLAAILADGPMEITDADHDQTIGQIWDEAFAQRIADQIRVDPSALAVTSAQPVGGRAQELPDGWQIVAVDYPETNPLGVLGAYLAERLTRPGTEIALAGGFGADAEHMTGSDFSMAWTDTTLVIIGYESVAAFTDPQADTTHAEAVVEAVSKAFASLPIPPDRTDTPSPRPSGTDDPASNPEQDPSMEAALPTSVAGEPLTISSAATVRHYAPDDLAGGLFGHLLPHFDQPGSDAALGFAASEESPVFTIAHRLTGRTGDQLLAAALGELWANPSGFQLYRSAEVDGRRFVYHQDWGFFAQGDVLYFFLYYGGYDCSEDRTSCTFGPDPETHQRIHDIVRAIPEASSGAR